MRSTQDGTPICSFSVAVDQRNGRDKTTNWWRCSMFGARGSALAQYLTKGSSVTVSGEFSLSEYEGKPQLNIRANEIALQGGKAELGERERSANGDRQQASQRSNGGGQGGRPVMDDDLDSDIPFVRADTVW